ncbi:N-acetylmuramoyl-L-alanine amidase [Tabrizicola sp.]|uniref:N-acetylmuramoyl-L-alanine amidase n=1 Tax=Tabrizicola sp. TaxID=2005166 RepID=UPI003F67F39E
MELVVLHYTAMRTCVEALDRLCDPGAEVSAHYLIDRDGTVLSLVDEAVRAWHAGTGSWAGEGDVNSRSIGIELVNTGSEPFAERQMTALEKLLSDVLGRHDLPPQAVIAHSDMAPDRKGDPGPRFDWLRLAVQGLSVWPLAVRPGDFARDLRSFGYPDALPDVLLNAFRLRFRPWAKGALDDIDRALAADLAARFPVDGRPPHA